MNVDTAISLLMVFVAFFGAAIFVFFVGSFQDQLSSTITDEGDLGNEAQSALDDQVSTFPTMFDSALAIILVVVTLGAWYVSYLFGNPALSLVIGLIIIFLGAWTATYLESWFVQITETMGGYQNNFPVTNFLLSNFAWYSVGATLGAVFSSTLGRGGI